MAFHISTNFASNFLCSKKVHVSPSIVRGNYDIYLWQKKVDLDIWGKHMKLNLEHEVNRFDVFSSFCYMIQLFLIFHILTQLGICECQSFSSLDYQDACKSFLGLSKCNYNGSNNIKNSRSSREGRGHTYDLDVPKSNPI